MDTIRWQHCQFDKTYTKKVLDLRQKVFGEDHYDETRWRWQYEDNPSGKSFIDLAVDKQEPGILAGHYAVISYKLNWDNQVVDSVQSLDTFTSSDYRRQGIFVDLAEITYANAKGAGNHIVFGFPNKNSYPGFVKKLDFIDPFGFCI